MLGRIHTLDCAMPPYLPLLLLFCTIIREQAALFILLVVRNMDGGGGGSSGEADTLSKGLTYIFYCTLQMSCLTSDENSLRPLESKGGIGGKKI